MIYDRTNCKNCGAPFRGTWQNCEYCGTVFRKALPYMTLPANAAARYTFPESDAQTAAALIGSAYLSPSTFAMVVAAATLFMFQKR